VWSQLEALHSSKVHDGVLSVCEEEPIKGSNDNVAVAGVISLTGTGTLGPILLLAKNTRAAAPRQTRPAFAPKENRSGRVVVVVVVVVAGVMVSSGAMSMSRMRS
jgi:hypothetical protein